MTAPSNNAIDPSMRPSNAAAPADTPLFAATNALAYQTASKFFSQRCRQIMSVLQERGPCCIFEIAAFLSVPPSGVNPGRIIFDHQISGRFGKMVEDGLIARTGHHKVKESTGCQCDEYRITAAGIDFMASSKGVRT